MNQKNYHQLDLCSTREPSFLFKVNSFKVHCRPTVSPKHKWKKGLQVKVAEVKHAAEVQDVEIINHNCREVQAH